VRSNPPPALLLFLAALLIPLAVSAQTDIAIPSAEESLVDLEVRFDPAATTGPDQVRGVVTARIQEGWHVNSARPTDDFAIPTTLRIESEVLKIERIDYPAHVERAFAFTGGQKLAVYEGSFEIPFHASRGGAEGNVRAVLSYQACNDRLCLPPREATVTVHYPEGTASASQPAPYPPQSASFTPLSAAPPAGAPPSLFQSDIGGTLASRGLLITLVAVFVLGLALNLTPCVYPLIPITVAYFSSQTEGKTSRRIGLPIFYVLGLAVMYSALGVFSAMSGRLFGSWLQQPLVLILFAVLMLVLAASMFGLYEIRVPQFLTRRAGARSGYLGAATMGLLAGVVAAPCVGPFILSLIALVGQRGDALLGFILFFVLALGLGLPYLFLGAFSSGLSTLPRSGAWMVQIKKALGFVLIAMAFYFLRPLAGEEIYRWGVGLSLLFGAIFLLVQKEPNRAGNMIRIALALLLAIVSAVYLLPRPEGPSVEWSRYEDAAIQAARLTGKAVMIDFYADWCLPCKELDEKTFTHPQVIAESHRFVRLKADLTHTGDALSRELSERYRIFGVPTIVFLRSDGKEADDLRLAGFEDAQRFLERMRQVP
jgi:thiol:disulfide interchange protein DsbD